MSGRFKDVLDDCLERIINRGDTIEHCLEIYPEWADELEPLLRTAVSVKEATSFKARPEFQMATKSKLMSAIAAKREEESKSSSIWSAFQRRWVVAVTLIIVLLIAGGGTVGASINSLPGDLLYPVKTATERVQAFFTFGNEDKTNLYAKFAERRVEEIEDLVARQREVPNTVLTRMKSDTEKALDLATEDGSFKREVVVRLIKLTSEQKAVLQRISVTASPEVKQRLQEALDRSVEANLRAVNIEKRWLRPHDSSDDNEASDTGDAQDTQDAIDSNDGKDMSGAGDTGYANDTYDAGDTEDASGAKDSVDTEGANDSVDAGDISGASDDNNSDPGNTGVVPSIKDQTPEEMDLTPKIEIQLNNSVNRYLIP